MHLIVILLYLLSLYAEAMQYLMAGKQIKTCPVYYVPPVCRYPSTWDSGECRDELNKARLCVGELEDRMDDMLQEYPFFANLEEMGFETELSRARREERYIQNRNEWICVFAMILGTMFLPLVMGWLLARFMDFVVYKVTSCLKKK